MIEPRSILWQQIRDFEIDAPGAKLTFAARLARENGWEPLFARRVVDEYKRFVFLAMVAGHEVTPSDEVDEAWHLHLVYTQSYWNRLCRDVLKRPLHHVPTLGGSSESARHVDQYERTLASYAEWFGGPPPTDIWPPADVRFDANRQTVRIDRHSVWILPKPRWPKCTATRAPFIAGAWLAPLVVGIANPMNLTGPEFLTFYSLIWAIALFVAAVLRHLLRTDVPAVQEPLPPYAVACLGGGLPAVLRSCLAKLVVGGRMLINDERLVPRGLSTKLKQHYWFRSVAPPADKDHDLERMMLERAHHENGASAAELLEAAKPAAQEIFTDLQSKGLLEANEGFAPARLWPVLLLSTVWLLGASKFLVGSMRDKPVLFLGIMQLVLVVVIYLFWRRPLRTRQGQAVFRQLQDKYNNLQRLELRQHPIAAATPSLAPFTGDLLLAAGLFGLAAVHHPDIDRMSKALKPMNSGIGGGGGCGTYVGCGAGCGGGGGGGCGGGGGGCGGCGGGD